MVVQLAEDPGSNPVIGNFLLNIFSQLLRKDGNKAKEAIVAYFKQFFELKVKMEIIF